MSTETDCLIGLVSQPTALGPPPYPEQPPPYTAPPRGHQHPHYAAPPPPYGQPHPLYAAPSPPQAQPYPQYGSAPRHNMTIVQTRVDVDVKPRDYIVLSLLTAVCFCPLCGCLALCFALQVDSAWDAGDHVKARQNSKRAVRLSLAGIIIGVLVVGFWVIYIIIAVV